MIRYALGDSEPQINQNATIAEDAVVIGDVRIGANCVIGNQVVLRGDDAPILIGDGVAIGPRSVIHVTAGRPTIIDSSVVIGAAVHTESSHIMRGAMIGDGAVILAGAVVGVGAVVAPRSTVTGEAVIGAGQRVSGSPAKTGS